MAASPSDRLFVTPAKAGVQGSGRTLDPGFPLSRERRTEGVIVKENCWMDEPIKLEIFTDYV